MQPDIRAHIEKHLGAIHQVFNEWADEVAPISVNHVAPSDVRPVHTLVTSGMSARALPGEMRSDAPRFLELMITLPREWQLDPKSYKLEEWFWPLRLLHMLAQWPQLTGSPLTWGQRIANGAPPQPYASTTKLCAALIVPSLLVPTEFYELKTDAKTVTFFAVVPLYKEELEFGERAGTQALLERIVDRDVNDVVDPKRKNVARKRFGLF